jgi:hypothetical protein
LTPPSTLQPEEAEETIRRLLKESADCDAPCFWEIVPGETSLGEARNIFTRLGLSLEFTLAEGGSRFYAAGYDFDDGLSIEVILTVQNNIVENLRVYLTPDEHNAGVPRAWSTFSPERLIQRYGLPSKVDIFFDGGAPYPAYFIDLYFDAKDLVIEYYSYDLGPNLRVCPLVDQMSSVRIWMGQNPVNPPFDAVLLEEATSITMAEFSKLMTNDSNRACFQLNIEAFQ